MKKFFDLDKHFENDSMWSDITIVVFLKKKKDIMIFKACSPGTYGHNCKQNCSAVCNENPCHYVDGSCFCKDGQNGDYCNNSKWYPFCSWSLLLTNLNLFAFMKHTNV